MNTWFTVKVRYGRATDNKDVTEQYLVDAMTFTEAEARITGELRTLVGAHMEVRSMSRTNIHEIFNTEDEFSDKWYRVQWAFITVSEKNGKEKRARHVTMVRADCTANAEREFHKRMKGTMQDYEVESVTETGIRDVYPYAPEKQSDETR